jgi:hypothetical protein
MRYLVDLGRLIPVTAVTARDALHLALLDLGCEGHVDRSARVYEFDQEGEVLIGVVPCELEERRKIA